MWNLKYGINEPPCKTDSETWRSDLWLPRRRAGGRGMHQECGFGGCKLLRIEWKNNKVLMYSMGTPLLPAVEILYHLRKTRIKRVR